VGSGSIKVESLDVTAHIAKLVFVFDEETGSDDFHERSTSWVIFKQYGFNVSIPIGRADPDWMMIGTNNATIWHWKLEKTLYVEYQGVINQFWVFPCECFTIDFYVASNISRWFSASAGISSFSASIDQHGEAYNQSWCPYQPEGCPELSRISISISHNSEYRIVAGMLYAILIIIIAIAAILPAKMGDNDSDFFTISSTILVFVPVLFFAFRDIAPPYLTLFDAVCLTSAIIYGGLILGKLIYRKQPKSKKAKDRKSARSESYRYENPEKGEGINDKKVEAGMLSPDIERRINRLDSLFLWVCSLSALGFSVFVGYLQIPVAPYIPVFILVACSVSFGYISGAVFSDSFTERIRGWNYLLMGLAIYVPFAAIEFGKSQIEMILPDIPRASMYFQLLFGSAVPLCYILSSRKMLPKLYASFRMPKGKVTNAILRSSFLGGLYLACILYLSALALQHPESALSIKALYVLFIALFLIPLTKEELRIMWLLRLEGNQHFIEHETIIIHRRLPKIAMGLIVFGIATLIVLLEFATQLPLSPQTYYLPIILFLLAMFAPIAGLFILSIVGATRDRFIVKNDIATKLSPEDFEALRSLTEKLNNY